MIGKLDDLELDGQEGLEEEKKEKDLDINPEQLQSLLSNIPLKNYSLSSSPPRHVMRRSLKAEEDLWMEILKRDKDSTFIKYTTKPQATAKRTRMYHARTYLTWGEMGETEVGKKLRRFTIAIGTNPIHLHFIKLPEDDELLDEL